MDAVPLLKAYHEIARPIDVMKLVRGRYGPRAKVGMIDRNAAERMMGWIAAWW